MSMMSEQSPEEPVPDGHVLLLIKLLHCVLVELTVQPEVEQVVARC